MLELSSAFPSILPTTTLIDGVFPFLFAEADFTEADFTEADFAEADFAEADFAEADFAEFCLDVFSPSSAEFLADFWMMC